MIVSTAFARPAGGKDRQGGEAIIGQAIAILIHSGTVRGGTSIVDPIAVHVSRYQIGARLLVKDVVSDLYRVAGVKPNRTGIALVVLVQEDELEELKVKLIITEAN